MFWPRKECGDRDTQPITSHERKEDTACSRASSPGDKSPTPPPANNVDEGGGPALFSSLNRDDKPTVERHEDVGWLDPMRIVVSAEEDRRVLHKLDRLLIPLMMGAYTLQYIDRSAMSYAAVFSFRTDLRLTSEQYSWLGSVYFFGYLAFEFPGSWMLQRLPISKVMGCMILSWGILVMCMAAPRRFAGMAVIRTLLGVSESLVTPGFVLLVSRFYKREEQPLRVGFWYCCNGLGNFLGGLLSYGMGHLQVQGVPNWAWIFLLNGAITILFAFIFLWLCPESPEKYGGFNDHERAVALERVRGNKSSLSSKKWKWGQFKEALYPWIDPQGWAYFFIVLSLSLANGGIALFLHLILQSYGFDPLETILMGLPGAALQIFFPLTCMYIARKWPGLRCYCIMAYVVPALAGVVIQYMTRNRGALLFGYYILLSYVASLSLCFAAPGANVTGYTKRVTVSAMIYVAYATGNIIGPHFFDSTESPPYRTGMLASIVCFAVTVPLTYALRCYLARENRRRDAVMRGQGRVYDPLGGDFADRTDVENMEFRYAL